ncbi:nonsense-mediated mRNA decay factor SMG9 [Anabrus simplex]|uniref:nonsense-mediated mRNA decay factor SMG9 n=1 Tax=Anabrus simplex TaxID=316456 RepID=UPI0035A2BE71
MSDFERGRDIKHKKFYGPNKDRRDYGPGGSRRMPILLTKPDRDRDGDKDRSDARSPAKPVPQPTIMVRVRDGDSRPSSSASRPPSVLRKENETAQPLYHLAGKHVPAENINPLAPPPEMKGPIKLLDESFQFVDGALEYLLEQSDFLVVGILGLQGAGKSTVLNLVAEGSVEKCARAPLFKPQGPEQLELGSHCTSGVDLLVTPNRVILLDTQPMLSASVMDRLVQLESSKKFVAPEFTSTENALEIQSLQLAAFLLSVCHVVIVVQDWFFDPNILRFLHSAEMLKPSTPTTTPDEEIIEYFPHVLFLQNRARPSDFAPRQIKLMQDIYNRTFLRSRLLIQSGMGIATGDVANVLNPSLCGEPINLFLIPDLFEPEEKGQYRGHPGVSILISKLRNQLHGVTRNPLTHTTLTEKNWYHYASKVWEGIKKSSFFMEYSRLLP